MPETTILLGPWAPDHPAYAGNKIASGGVVILEDAKGVYPTIGGYRPLVVPGTAVASFTNSDFAEYLTPNTLDAAALADGWFDADDATTLTTVKNGITEWITQWRNKITGATNHGTFCFLVGGNEYCSLAKVSNETAAQINKPSGEYASNIVGSYHNGTVLEAGYSNGGAMDFPLSATHTGTTFWFSALVHEHFYPVTGRPDIIFAELGNDGEIAEDNADSAVIRRDGTTLRLAVVRDGETDAYGSTYQQLSNFLVTVIFDGTDKKIRINGTEIDSQSSTTAFDISRMRVGGRGDLEDVPSVGGAANPAANYCWWGLIHNLVFGTGTLTDDLAEQVEGHILHSKALTTLLPSGHTYKTVAPQSSASTTGANEPTSHFMCWSRSGSPFFFIGDYDKLWLLNQAFESFDDVTNASTNYLASRELPWQFAQFGNRVIAVTKNTPPQYYDLGTSATFADLPGSPPNARAVAQVRDFLFLGSLTESDGETYEYRVRWSGFDDSEDWTTDPGGTQADFQDLDAQYGEVMAIVGGEYATVLQQRAITRFTYRGDAAVWQRDTIEINRGTIAPLSVIQVGRLIYYYSHDGFWAFDGSTSHRISGDQIHRWVENRLSEGSAQDMRVDYDPDRRIIVWAWPYDPDGAGRATSGLQLIYNYDDAQQGNRWSYNIDTQTRWWIVRGPPVQDYLDDSEELLDDTEELLDDETPAFARTLALNYDGELWRLSELDGGDAVCRIETGKIALSPSVRSMVMAGRVVGNIDASSTITLAINSNPAYPSNSLAASAGSAEITHNLTDEGFFAVRSEGRYHGIMCQWDGGKGTTSGDLEELDVVQGFTLEYKLRGKH